MHSLIGGASIRYLVHDAIDHAVPPTGVGVRSGHDHRHVQEGFSMQIGFAALTRREKVTGMKIKPMKRRGAPLYHPFVGLRRPVRLMRHCKIFGRATLLFSGGNRQELGEIAVIEDDTRVAVSVV